MYQSLSHQLKKQGNYVKVIAGSFTNNKLVGKIEATFDHGVPIFFVPLLPYPKLRSMDTSTYTIPTLSAIIFVTKQLLENKNAIVHLHGLSHPIIDCAAVECIVLRKKYVLTCHGIPKTPERASLPIRLLFKLYLSTIERIVVQKAFAATFVSKSLIKECAGKKLVNKEMIVIPNGLYQNLAKIDSKTIEAIKQEYCLREKRVIFAIGRLNPTKGFQHLIEAMKYVKKQLPETIAIIAGSGPYKKDLENLIRHLNISDYVKLIGHVNEARKAALYDCSDVVVFPSMQEPFGMVILEAFMRHKPVIAFNTDSAREIIEDKTDGLLVPLGDNKKLAENIIQVLTNIELREKLVGNVDYKIGAFRWEEIIQKYETVYMKACREKFADFEAGSWSSQ